MVKPSFNPRPALGLLMAALLAVGGCAYTTVTARERPHAPLPPVKAGLKAVMAGVADKRNWQGGGPDAAIPDVRLFAPEITDQLRRELLASGLFAALPKPADPEARGLQAGLHLEMTAFSLAKLGTNAWVVPHLMLDGVALPVFTGAAIYSQGRMDLGSYLLPSNRMGTAATLRLAYAEGPEGTLLEKEYSTKVDLEQVSERKYLETINDTSTHGVAMSRQEGRKTLTQLVQNIASDPFWEYLPVWRRIVTVESMFKAGKPLDEVAAAVEKLLPLLDAPLVYVEEETKVLRDGFLDAKARAGIVNDLRARWQGLPDVKSLPSEQTISEERAEELFDDPKLPGFQEKSIIAERVIRLAFKVIDPSAPTVAPPAPTAATQVVPPVAFRAPAAGVAPELAPGAPVAARLTPAAQPASPALAPVALPLPPEKALALRQHLSQELAKRVSGDLRLQVLLVAQAEKAVGTSWAPMRELLGRVGAAYTNKYLTTRNG
jgi:hypothetical protein